jgi:dihydrofolate reductase
MDLHLIWAQDKNRAIGKLNTLPWRLPEDLKHFKELTLGHPVIMGRNTFESLPGPLPGRQNIVMTRGQGLHLDPRVVKADGWQSALLLAGGAQPARAYIIGGAEVYNSALKVADCIEMTEVDLEVEGADAYAPEIPDNFRLEHSSDWLTSANGLRYQFRRYRNMRRR